MYKLILYIRATLFWIIFASSTIIYGSTLWILFLFPKRYRLPVTLTWNKLNLTALKLFCGVTYRAEGLENLPSEGAAIAIGNHQSTWETIAIPLMIPPQTWVLKKQLLRVPFFGWGLAMVDPIAIDRTAGKTAVEQVIEQGTKRLETGTWMVIFPEGTRVKPGEYKRYKMGGALLAEASRCPIVPLAHNAGLLWPKHQYIKHPGTITIRFGQVIDSNGKTAQEINGEAETWIRSQVDELCQTKVSKPSSRDS